MLPFVGHVSLCWACYPTFSLVNFVCVNFVKCISLYNENKKKLQSRLPRVTWLIIKHSYEWLYNLPATFGKLFKNNEITCYTKKFQVYELTQTRLLSNLTFLVKISREKFASQDLSVYGLNLQHTGKRRHWIMSLSRFLWKEGWDRRELFLV